MSITFVKYLATIFILLIRPQRSGARSVGGAVTSCGGRHGSAQTLSLAGALCPTGQFVPLGSLWSMP